MRRHICRSLSATKRAAPIGTRFPGKACKGLILGPGSVGGSIGEYEERYVHEISTYKKSLGKGECSTWTIGKEGRFEYIYVRCHFCGDILKTGVKDVDRDGFVVPSVDDSFDHYHCLQCEKCHMANYPYLDGWKKVINGRRKIKRRARS